MHFISWPTNVAKAMCEPHVSCEVLTARAFLLDVVDTFLAHFNVLLADSAKRTIALEE